MNKGKGRNFGTMLDKLQAEAQRDLRHLDEPVNRNAGAVEAAQFDIIVKRDSANIGEYLPFPIFGAGALESGLQQEYASYAPSSAIALVAIQFGMKFSKTATGTLVETLANAQKLVLQYHDGAAFDTITVTCTSASYPTFVNATISDVFRLKNIRYSISDITQTDQYSQTLFFTKNTIFGKDISNKLTPASFRSPQDMQTGIVDIQVNADVDKDTVLWHSIKNVSQFKITLSVFVSRTVRFNSNML